ncbi:MAG TPA: sigma 54-interacting transcriptional regulator [Candidatus Binatia bacterium]|jgi:transcriptional regulator with GAF, ATPase, and Fis domain|nr:sigma 54-interacting transcriptional regulator [Candidatus Binatia bacterium]
METNREVRRSQAPFERTLPSPRIETTAAFSGIVGSAPALCEVFDHVRKVAPTDATVLITGETGTGKELLARAIHERSARAARPFISVSCGAIPQSLIASELFGHERGAFTGAMQRRLGRFELAAGGTLFLDEVGELPPETQVALLRVLQEREFERVGGTASIRADVRVVAATNRHLEDAVADGAFRSDLYYRLSVFPMQMPPLRLRPGDIRPLVEHFVHHYARRVGKVIRSISPTAFELLETYSWPGNVRELQNVVERSIVMSDGDTFRLDDTWLRRRARTTAPSWSSPPAVTLEDIEREAIVRALRSTNGTVGGPRGAAALLGVKRTTLQARMQKLGIVPTRHLEPTDDRVAVGS